MKIEALIKQAVCELVSVGTHKYIWPKSGTLKKKNKTFLKEIEKAALCPVLSEGDQ